MYMVRPLPAVFFAARCIVSSAPRALTSTMRSSCSSVRSAMGVPRSSGSALATTMSMEPNRSLAWANKRSTSAGWEMSAWTAMACPPCSRTSLSAWSALGAVRPTDSLPTGPHSVLTYDRPRVRKRHRRRRRQEAG